jgi:ribosomal protein L12E/L44/L45/RPP1/RPP2
MRAVAAYLLASLGGNANPDAAALKSILEAGGVEVDAEAIDKVRICQN